MNYFAIFFPHKISLGSRFRAPRYLVRLNEALQRLGVVGKRSPKAQGLLCLREPLQQHLHGRPELLCLRRQKHRRQPSSSRNGPLDGLRGAGETEG